LPDRDKLGDQENSGRAAPPSHESFEVYWHGADIVGNENSVLGGCQFQDVGVIERFLKSFLGLSKSTAGSCRSTPATISK
jgi:hypothetical protein